MENATVGGMCKWNKIFILLAGRVLAATKGPHETKFVPECMRASKSAALT